MNYFLIILFAAINLVFYTTGRYLGYRKGRQDLLQSLAESHKPGWDIEIEINKEAGGQFFFTPTEVGKFPRSVFHYD